MQDSLPLLSEIPPPYLKIKLHEIWLDTRLGSYSRH